MIKNKNGEYKVPFCNVYCVGFKNWIKECIWIFGVRKIFPYWHLCRDIIKREMSEEINKIINFYL